MTTMSQATDRIILTASGARVAITERLDPNAKTTAIILHGFQSSRRGASALAAMDAATEAGLHAVAADFYAHGESDGEFKDLSIAKAIETIAYVIADIHHRNPKQRIILIGASFGGLIAQYASVLFSQHVTGLILRAPVSDWRALWQHRLTADEIKDWETRGFHTFKGVTGTNVTVGRDFLDDIKRNDIYDPVAPQIKIPVLIVHGDADEVVPLAQSKKLQTIFSDCELIILPEADHRLSRAADMKFYQQHVLKFLRQQN